jgi:hypothetical protein
MNSPTWYHVIFLSLWFIILIIASWL